MHAHHLVSDGHACILDAFFLLAPVSMTRNAVLGGAPTLDIGSKLGRITSDPFLALLLDLSGTPRISARHVPLHQQIRGPGTEVRLRRIATPRYPDIVGDAFELLHHEGGQVFSLSVHPWLMGMAHRIKYLDEALRRIERFGNIWQATPGEIAQHYMMTMA